MSIADISFHQKINVYCSSLFLTQQKQNISGRTVVFYLLFFFFFGDFICERGRKFKERVRERERERKRKKEKRKEIIEKERKTDKQREI